jgi:hypothetical protein
MLQASLRNIAIAKHAEFSTRRIVNVEILTYASREALHTALQREMLHHIRMWPAATTHVTLRIIGVEKYHVTIPAKPTASYLATLSANKQLHHSISKLH